MVTVKEITRHLTKEMTMKDLEGCIIRSKTGANFDPVLVTDKGGIVIRSRKNGLEIVINPNDRTYYTLVRRPDEGYLVHLIWYDGTRSCESFRTKELAEKQAEYYRPYYTAGAVRRIAIQEIDYNTLEYLDD